MRIRRASYRLIAVSLGVWFLCLGAIPMKVQCVETCSGETNRRQVSRLSVPATQAVPPLSCCCKAKAPAKKSGVDCASTIVDFSHSGMGVAGCLQAGAYGIFSPSPSPLERSYPCSTCCDYSNGSKPHVSDLGLIESIVKLENVSFSALSWLSNKMSLSCRKGIRPNDAESPPFAAARPLYLDNLSLLI